MQKTEKLKLKSGEIVWSCWRSEFYYPEMVLGTTETEAIEKYYLKFQLYYGNRYPDVKPSSP